RDTNIGGHAEINAISNTIKNIGTQNFNQLNRDSLILITTFEPCLMCRGAIIENRIKHIEFIKEKTLRIG
ncbi:MAG TPA: deaminase, partial [Bacteroidia bacterium]|nr:deaminase [Bacteroidia bacterium]